MAKFDNKRLTPNQKKDLAAALRSLGVYSANVNDLLNGQHRRQIFEHYQKRSDFVFSHQGQRIRLPFSSLAPRRIADVVQSTPKENSQSEPEQPIQELKRKGRGKGKNPVKTVTSVALDPELLEQLKERAEMEERSIGALIRIAVKQYLKGE